MLALLSWIEDRTGAIGFLRRVFFHSIPGSSSWRRVWGALVLFAIGVECVTGVFLWLVYSPGAFSAWESVHYVQSQVAGGWFLRGIHHYVAQVMLVLLLLHLLQMVLAGLYRPPREFHFWVYVLMMLVVMATSFTGYVLPWDRRGFMAAHVSSGLLTNVPWVGQWLRTLMLGGPEPGHQTLTRFFAWHAGVLPALTIALIAIQAILSARTARKAAAAAGGAASPAPGAGGVASESWWPGQARRDAVACFAFMAIMSAIVLVAHGAPLGAPADPGEQDSAARPDWYFLFMFRMLHWDIFGGARQVIPAVLLPAAAIGFLMLMPFLGRWKFGHRFNAMALIVGVFGFFGLTAYAWIVDRRDPSFRAALAAAQVDADRVEELARRHGGIPPAGALHLLETDPRTAGARLFAKKCASCHAFNGGNGQGMPLTEKQSAADLAGFGSRQWLSGFLDPALHVSEKFWGGTQFVQPKQGARPSKMTRFVTEDVADFSPEQKEQLGKVIAALSAEAGLASQREIDARDASLIEEGRRLMGPDGLSCTDCHRWRAEEEGRPELNRWASRQWTIDFIANPGHDRFYASRNDRMPAYGEKKELTQRQIEMIVDWMRGEVD